MLEELVFEQTSDLMKHITEINVMIFTDENDGRKKAKTKIVVGGHEFQEVVAIGEPVSNLIFIQNRSINHLLEIVEEHIRDGRLIEIDDHPVSFASDAEIDPADIDPTGRGRY